MNFDNKFTEWKNNGTEPSDTLKENGFSAGYKPPANIFNWFWSKVPKAITEIQTKLAGEENARTNADTALQTKITNEAKARANADAPMRSFLESTANYTDTVNLTEITSTTEIAASSYNVGDILYIQNTDTSNIDYLASNIDPDWFFSETIISGQTYKVQITKIPVGGADMEQGVITVLDNITLRYELDKKQSTVTGGASTITSSDLAANRVLVSNANGKVSVSSTITSTELGYLDGVTSNLQTQISKKQSSVTGGASTITSSNLTANRALVSNSSGKVAVSAVTSTELGYLDGVTGNVQTQLNGKQETLDYNASDFLGCIEEVSQLCFEFGEELNFTNYAPQVNGIDVAISPWCSGTEYDTGKIWLDGSVIYRKDFAVRVFDTNVAWGDKCFAWSDIGLPTSCTIINSKAYGCTGLSTDVLYAADTMDFVENIDTNTLGVVWYDAAVPSASTTSTKNVLNIWGYVEYCKTNGGIALSAVTHTLK